MKYISKLLIVSVLVLSLSLVVPIKSETAQNQLSESIVFSDIILNPGDNNYLIPQMKGTNTYLENSGKPMLPVCHLTYTFKENIELNNVQCYFGDTREVTISKKILPSESTYPLNENVPSIPVRSEDPLVYEVDNIFPEKNYEYTIRCGLDENGYDVFYLIIDLFPIRYNPIQNKLIYVTNVDLFIDFEINENKQSSLIMDEYDLVIIAPSDFQSELQPLIQHKNDNGVRTFLKTTDDIYTEYQGVDKPEQIKYFLKDAKESYNISFVLLVGGLKSYIFAIDKDDQNQGSSDWFVPVRYANVQYGFEEKNTISDLYYADLYRINATTHEKEFEDWDSNNDGIFAAWGYNMGRDTLDFIPDIYYGRLACRNKWEVKTVVNKIITYESTSADEKSWFNTMIGVGGRTFKIEDNGQPDGEYACDTAIQYMGENIEPVRVYASNRDSGGLIPVSEDIKSAISDGAGYVSFEGHGNPLGWNTHWVDGDEWTGGIGLYSLRDLTNGEKLPVVIIGGCHNGLFNVTVVRTLTSYYLYDADDWYWTHGQPAPVCFSWGFLMMPNGGAIGSTGCTGLGLGPTANATGVLQNSAALEGNFFYKIGQDGAVSLGEAHGGAVRKYVLETVSIGATQAFCIVEYQLFGDPSLHLGGFD